MIETISETELFTPSFSLLLTWLSNSMEEDIGSSFRWKSNSKKLNVIFHITIMLLKCTTFKTWHNIDVCRRYILGKNHTYNSSSEIKSHWRHIVFCFFFFDKKSASYLTAKFLCGHVPIFFFHHLDEKYNIRIRPLWYTSEQNQV